MGKISTIKNRWKEFKEVVDENIDHINWYDSLSEKDQWGDYREYCYHWKKNPSTWASYLWYRAIPYRYIAKAVLCFFIGHTFKVAGCTDNVGKAYEICSRCGFEGRRIKISE